MSFNKATLVGRVGKDPEIKYTGSGRAVANFSIATESQWKNSAGEKQKRTEWHRCVSWGKLAEVIGQYVKKGSLLLVEGRIETRNWEDRDKIKRYTTEIIVNEMKMLGGKPGGSSTNSSDTDGSTSDDFDAPGGEQVTSRNTSPAPEITDEDIPF